MRFQSGGGRRRLSINLTSLIDVLFLLVIFVLVSARFEDAAGIDVNLPHGATRELPKEQTLVLTLTAGGKTYLNEAAVPDGALGTLLEEAAAMAQETVLVVKADRQVPWERVAAALDTAKRAGLTRLNFPMRQ